MILIYGLPSPAISTSLYSFPCGYWEGFGRPHYVFPSVCVCAPQVKQFLFKLFPLLLDLKPLFNFSPPPPPPGPPPPSFLEKNN